MHVEEKVNCTAEWLHKSFIFFFLFSHPQIKKKERLAENHLVCLFQGAVGTLRGGLRECDLPEIETETSRDKVKRALKPSATSTFGECERAGKREIDERSGERVWLEKGRAKVKYRESER